MTSHRRSYTSIVFMVVIVCCSPADSAGQATFDLKKARVEIEAVNRRFSEALRKGDAAGLAAFFTEDAKSMGPNEPAHEGRAKIHTVYAGYIAEGATELTLTTTGLWAPRTC